MLNCQPKPAHSFSDRAPVPVKSHLRAEAAPQVLNTHCSYRRCQLCDASVRVYVRQTDRSRMCGLHCTPGSHAHASSDECLTGQHR